MANPRRITLSSVAAFLKRPQSLPFLLSIFIFLTWISLRFQNPSSISSRSTAKTLIGDDDANLVRFSAVESASLIAGDRRGWLLDPIVIAHKAGIHGGARTCASVHVGEIRPGGVRGNHRHHASNETFVIWGANTKFRLENPNFEDKGYAEVIIGAEEVAVAASPAGTAHALINVDRMRPTFFLGCQDFMVKVNSSHTDYHIWKDFST